MRQMLGVWPVLPIIVMLHSNITIAYVELGGVPSFTIGNHFGGDAGAIPSADISVAVVRR